MAVKIERIRHVAVLQLMIALCLFLERSMGWCNLLGQREREKFVLCVGVKDPCFSNQKVSSFFLSAILSSDVWQPTIVARTEASGTDEDMANVCIWSLSYVVV